MGWKVPHHRLWLAVFSQWCRLCTISQERINCRMFVWARRCVIEGFKTAYKKHSVLQWHTSSTCFYGFTPLCLETGQYESLPEEERICPPCNVNTVESDYHEIMSCQFYDDIREELFTCAMFCNDDFYHMYTNDKFVFI